MINRKYLTMLLSSLLICETIYIWEDIYDKFEYFFFIEIFKNNYFKNTLYSLGFILSILF